MRRLLAPMSMLLVACAGSGEAISSTTEATTPSTTITASPPPDTAASTTAVELPHLAASQVLPGGLPIDIYARSTGVEGPAVVLLHGGGWFGGEPSTMAPLASELAGRGMVAFNATYRTSNGGYPESFDDVACAVRFAVAQAAGYSLDAGAPLLVGHSAGAQLASVIALAGDSFTGDCPLAGSALPRALVGLAGPYDVTEFKLVLASYFGTRYEVDPEPWEAGNAISYLGENPDLWVLLIHGDADDFVPLRSSRQFEQALTDAGYRVALEVLPGVDHAQIRHPAVVADLIAEFARSLP